MRKLVTIRTVSEIKPIIGADLIELAIVDGWQCVTKKGEFVVGQKGLYFEIDSFLPAEDSRFSFLEKTFTTFENKRGARIRTIKLRGQLSQGLLLPLSLFPEVRPHKFGYDGDFSELLKVSKWEKPEDLLINTSQGKVNWFHKKLKKLKYTKLKPLILWLETNLPGWFVPNTTKPFPSFIPKTDQERIQNLKGKLDFESDVEFEYTIKLDGSSTTMYYNRGRFGVCSRNFDLKRENDNQFWQVANTIRVEQALKLLGRNIALQGELMGPGIQGNREKFTIKWFYLFCIWDIDNQRYLSRNEKLELYMQLNELGAYLTPVPSPTIKTGSLKNLGFKTVDDVLAFAEGPSIQAKTREGIVAWTVDGTFSFKAISNSYLLEKGN